MEVMRVGWKNPFYQALWKKAGVQPGDIRSLGGHHQAADLQLRRPEDRPARAPAIWPAARIFEPQRPSRPYANQTAKQWRHYRQNRASRCTVSPSGNGTRLAPRGQCTSRGFGQGHHADSCDLLTRKSGLGDLQGLPRLSRRIAAHHGQRHRDHESATDRGCLRRRCELLDEFSGIPPASCRASKAEFGRDIRELNTKLITSFLGPDTEGTLRAQIESLWGCPVFDNYGTNEVGQGAFECEHRNGLHLMEDAMYFEILDTERTSRFRPARLATWS